MKRPAPSDRRRPLRRTFALLALPAASLACSGSDDAPPAPPEATTATAISTTTDTPTTSTEPATTTTSSTTTAAPTTTIDEEALLITQVEQAYFDAHGAGTRAFYTPADPTARESLKDHYAEGALENVIRILDDLVELGVVARENPDFGPSQATIIGAVRFDPDRDSEATLIACELNADWFVEPNAGPNGEDSVVRADVIRVDLAVRLAQGSDGRWRVISGGNARELVGVETCSE